MHANALYYVNFRVLGGVGYEQNSRTSAGRVALLKLALMFPHAVKPTIRGSQLKVKWIVWCQMSMNATFRSFKNRTTQKKWSVASMLSLMDLTAQWRRKWIKETGPSIQAILQTFPCLADPKLVSLFYTLVLNCH